jgi:hypothetical protein
VLVAVIAQWTGAHAKQSSGAIPLAADQAATAQMRT